jgi:UDP-2,4-diacetamido-2,4,6-trideoxy-beta-L-altropyranose hydrolase
MLENGRFLLIRADGGSDIGLGHLFRTLALAEAWAAKGGKLRLVSGSCPPSLAARFRELGTVMDATLTGAMECVGAENAAAIVLDTKHADEAWQIIADHPNACLLIEDTGTSRPISGCAILNQNFHAHAGLYPRAAADVTLLLGPRFALLRREFAAMPLRRPKWPPRLLLSFGGADPVNATSAALRMLAESKLQPGIDITVLVGAANPRGESIERTASELGLNCTFLHDHKEMAALLGTMDAIVAAAGSSVFEYAAARLPGMLIPIVEDQMAAATKLGECGLFLIVSLDELMNDPTGTAARLDDFLMLHRHSLPDVPENFKVDGLGADRVVSFLSSRAERRLS